MPEDRPITWQSNYSQLIHCPTRSREFSVPQNDKNGSGAHTASYSMGSRGSIPGGKTAGVWT
jgi:hypothetical protein